MENYTWPEITEYTTMEELQKIHKRIWNYAIEHGHKPDTPYANGCVGCEYNLLFYLDVHFARCGHCPIEWGEAYPCGGGSLYNRWYNAEDHATKRAYAELIRDLPFKKL